MTSSIVRDSSIGDAWIREMLAKNPIQWVVDQSGNRTGNILSGPVRLNYPNLLSRSKKKQDDGTLKDGNFNSGLLFAPGVDTSVLNEAYNAQLAMDCKDFYNAQTGQYYGLHSPFRDQAEKTVGKNTKGYTPGGLLMTASSNFQPIVVDRNMNPIVDEKRTYSGVWAIASMNVYTYGIKTNQPKKGVGFGLVSVMIVADDDKLDGVAAIDPRSQFGGVNVAPPSVQPSAMFGTGQPQAAAMPNTNAGFVTPAAPALQQAPAAPQLTTCWQCQKPMPATMQACPHCGIPQS